MSPAPCLTHCTFDIVSITLTPPTSLDCISRLCLVCQPVSQIVSVTISQSVRLCLSMCLQVPSARFMLRKAVLDAGAKQLDPFTVDVRGSLELYQQTAVVNREEMLAAEVQWLQSNNFDLVVSDVVPIVCAAAAAAGIPAVCVSNFSWGKLLEQQVFEIAGQGDLVGYVNSRLACGLLGSWVREPLPLGWQAACCSCHA